MSQYIKYNRALINVKAYFDGDMLPLNIIKFCKLEPDGSWQKWTDNNGYALVLKNRSFVIRKQNVKNKITDIYLKSNIEIISQNSYKSVIFYFENKNEQLFILSFLGDDNRLRCITYNGHYNNIMPLSLNKRILKCIINNLNNSNDFKVIDSNLRYKNFKLVKCWMSRWNPKDSLINEMIGVNKDLSEKLLTDCEVL
jgi:hypothetical protein